mmetsp:Transcript_4309/g.8647  ORF Transcript_4309/g.8647 Transcript_4309/m.8647 type:complete len:227 (-) Transcript_4309:2088-2768(-)
MARSVQAYRLHFEVSTRPIFVRVVGATVSLPSKVIKPPCLRFLTARNNVARWSSSKSSSSFAEERPQLLLISSSFTGMSSKAFTAANSRLISFRYHTDRLSSFSIVITFPSSTSFVRAHMTIASDPNQLRSWPPYNPSNKSDFFQVSPSPPSICTSSLELYFNTLPSKISITSSRVCFPAVCTRHPLSIAMPRSQLIKSSTSDLRIVRYAERLRLCIASANPSPSR